MKIRAGEDVGCGQRWYYFCPGCDCAHFVDDRWGFDGNMERPSFVGSVLVEGKNRCHSFVQAGQIQFLTDCDHKLAGVTVEMPLWPF